MNQVSSRRSINVNLVFLLGCIACSLLLATDGVVWSVCVSVCLFVTFVRLAKKDEQIEKVGDSGGLKPLSCTISEI